MKSTDLWQRLESATTYSNGRNHATTLRSYECVISLLERFVVVCQEYVPPTEGLLFLELPCLSPPHAMHICLSSSQFMVLPLISSTSLLRTRNSDQPLCRIAGRLSSPLPHSGSSLHFSSRETFSPGFPRWLTWKMALYALSAVDSLLFQGAWLVLAVLDRQA